MLLNLKNISISLIFLFFFINKGIKAQNLTLKQCVEQAIQNNIAVKQTGLLVDNARINLSQAKANQLPDVNGGFNYGFNQGRSVDPITNSYINQQLFSSNLNLSSGVVIYNGLRLKNLIKQNALNVEALTMDLQQAKDNLTLNVILAYLQVLSNEDVLTATQKQSESTQKQVERMTILVKNGAAGDYQLSDLKGQLSADALTILNAQNALQQAKLSLCQLMRVDFNPNLTVERTTIDPSPPPYATTSTEVYNKALQNLSALKANDFKIKVAETGIKVAETALYPTVSFNADLGSSYSSRAQKLLPTNISEKPTGDYVLIGGSQNPVLTKQQNFDTEGVGYGRQMNNNLGAFAGVRVQVPIFNNYQAKNRIKLAINDLKNSQFEAENVKQQLKQNIEQAWLNMQTTLNRHQILMEQVTHFEASYRAAEVRFKNGVINATEFLIVKNNLDRAKINVAQTQFEYIFRTKLLDFYQGKVLE
jgi:outer membrane protein